MNSIELMKQEHQNILGLLACMRSACCAVLDGAKVNVSDFQTMRELARAYADAHHHGKEEKILFPAMAEHLGPVAVNLIQHGMLVEHDMGRLHMSELETALNAWQVEPSTRNKLDIITAAGSYANLLQRHIEKEDAAVYAFAERSLPSDVMRDIAQRMVAFEEETATARDGYLQQLKTLKETYAVA